MLDATSRAIYRARALGLFRALLRTPDGRKTSCRVLLAVCPPSIRPMAPNCSRNFPTLSEQPATLSKMWTLSLADASASNRVMPLSVGETQKRLSLILEITAPTDPRKPRTGVVTGPEGLQAVARTNTGRYVLRQKAEDLLAARGEGASSPPSDRRGISHDRQPACRETTKKSRNQNPQEHAVAAGRRQTRRRDGGLPELVRGDATGHPKQGIRFALRSVDQFPKFPRATMQSAAISTMSRRGDGRVLRHLQERPASLFLANVFSNPPGAIACGCSCCLRSAPVSA